jgi:hypothetical protein
LPRGRTATLPTADTQTFVAESRRIAIRRRNLLTGSPVLASSLRSCSRV